MGNVKVKGKEETTEKAIMKCKSYEKERRKLERENGEGRKNI